MGFTGGPFFILSVVLLLLRLDELLRLPYLDFRAVIVYWCWIVVDNLSISLYCLLQSNRELQITISYYLPLLLRNRTSLSGQGRC
jgi:hypothetical protein